MDCSADIGMIHVAPQKMDDESGIITFLSFGAVHMTCTYSYKSSYSLPGSSSVRAPATCTDRMIVVLGIPRDSMDTINGVEHISWHTVSSLKVLFVGGGGVWHIRWRR